MIGIYKIENIINHKIYIGQSIRIMKRWNEHINVECDSLIHKAIKEYGYSNFTFTILELCKKDELDVKEIGKDKDFVFTVTVYVKPEATVKAYKGLEVKKHDK